MVDATRIWTPVDYNKDGKQTDCLRVPHSVDLSAYGWIPVPVICVRNGEGPTALLVAGNHGDEYEGQVALLNLARELEPEDICGRVIILPSVNFPAVQAGRRVSPLDEGNLNRLFPGDAVGTPTEMIAHYVSDVLIPMTDLVIDLHSGGRSLNYMPSALVRPGRTAKERQQLMELLKSFGAPIGFVSSGASGGQTTTLAAAAQMRNVLALTTELGGAATLSGTGLKLAEAGTRRLLGHIGILRRPPVETPPATRLMYVPSRNAYVYADATGIFEPAVSVGDEVKAGQQAGRIHHCGWPPRAPEGYNFSISGLVACCRAPSLTQPGDCLFKVVTDVSGKGENEFATREHHQTPEPTI
jgi:uncharacterized protein